ncbi:MAG: sulfatase [Caldilineaceae bacterium]|nr:sulfatase [Caldilineaceae bacterium]
MRAVMVMFDTLNRHMLPPYGCDWVHAPNFERLAERTVTFDNCFVGSMPCMPARRELHTGRYNFLHRSWGPLEPFDDSMPELLSENGIYTHLSTDHLHYFEDGGATYHTRYDSWDYHRGQEGDAWIGQVADPVEPPSLNRMRMQPEGLRRNDQKLRQDWINREHMQCEEKQPQAKTFAAGLDFLRRNSGQDGWFLQIETFDPHEPFFTHQKYKDLYPHEYDGEHFDWPPYRRVEETPEEVHHARYEYAALLSMCDEYLGKVLDLMDEQAMWDDTMLIVCTDHGYLLGEHDWWAKNFPPFYNEIAHTPLFVWDPRSRVMGVRRAQLTQMIDLPATLLDLFEVTRPPDMQGIALGNVVADDAPTREAVLFGVHGGHVNVTDGRYVYMRGPVDPLQNEPLFEYTLMPNHMRQRFTAAELQDIELAEPFSFTKGCRTVKTTSRKTDNPPPRYTLLFDLEADPGQESPIENVAQEARLAARMAELMRANDAPADQFERLGLSS